MLNDLKHDLRHAWRLMRSRPTPALLAIGAIALGIGVSTAVFSIFNAVLVRDLPYRDPGRLVMLWNTNDQAGMTLKQQKTQGRSLSLAEYRDWQGFSGGFERMIVFGSFLTRLGKTDDPEIVFGYQSAPGFFPLLGVSPLLGRGFTREDEKEGATPVVVLQHDFWKRRFHGDPAVLGKTVYLDNRLFTIVGVMAPDFVFFNRQIDFVSTATWRFQDVEKRRGDRFFRAMARLKPGVQEIGVRMALGANRPQVLSLVLRQGMKSVGTGILIGLAISAILTRFLQTLLFGVTPLDAGTFSIVALALLTAGCLASYLPALRAATLDPMVALRHE